MIKIVNTYLLNKTRPDKIRRDYKFPEKIKDGNLCGYNYIFFTVKCPIFR